jgi:error-prone DNA polymerase
MPGHIVVQWDKDSLEDAGLIKLDLLGLRMVGVLSATVDTMCQLTGTAPDLNALPLDDPTLFDLVRRSDTIGIFQVESRAQQRMAPRLQPVGFADLIVQIAIIRPGPPKAAPSIPISAAPVSNAYPHDGLVPVLLADPLRSILKSA